MGRGYVGGLIGGIRWYDLLEFCFFILVYIAADEKSHDFETEPNLMVIHLFRKKAVHLYTKSNNN